MEPAAIALVLQLGDSSFPSGAFTASWGLESLSRAGLVTDEADVHVLMLDQLRHRWATFDRVVAHRVAAVLGGGGGVPEVLALDALVDAMSLPPAQRAASRAAGAAFLRSAADALGGTVAARDRAVRRDGVALHLAVSHPLVLLDAGVALADVEIAGGMQLVQQLASAAVRLGLVGHRAAARVVTAGRTELVHLVAAPPEDLEPSQFLPLAEIAMYRHATLPTKVFRC